MNLDSQNKELSAFTASIFKVETFTDEIPINNDQSISSVEFRKMEIIIAKTLAFKLGLKHGAGAIEVSTWPDLSIDAIMVRVKLTVYSHR